MKQKILVYLFGVALGLVLLGFIQKVVHIFFIF